MGNLNSREVFGISDYCLEEIVLNLTSRLLSGKVISLSSFVVVEFFFIPIFEVLGSLVPLLGSS
jgi:hypothetical protein